MVPVSGTDQDGLGQRVRGTGHGRGTRVSGVREVPRSERGKEGVDSTKKGLEVQAGEESSGPETDVSPKGAYTVRSPDKWGGGEGFGWEQKSKNNCYRS